MHELGIAKELFCIIMKKAKENSLKKISKIRIKLGIASGIDADLLKHSFHDHLFKGTMAEGAEIEIMVEPIVLECKECKKKIDAEKNKPPIKCPYCSGFLQILSGKDVYVESIESDEK